jgi:hypothetical protein
VIRNLYSAFTIDTSTPTSTPNFKKHPLLQIISLVRRWITFLLPFAAFLSQLRTSLRNLTLTIQICDISQSFVSATKYENISNMCKNKVVETKSNLKKNLITWLICINCDVNISCGHLLSVQVLRSVATLRKASWGKLSHSSTNACTNCLVVIGGFGRRRTCFPN